MARVNSAPPAGPRAGRTRRAPVQERSRETVARILDAAEAIVVEHGPDAVTTRAIAERAGVAAPSIYRFFADRDEIFDGLLERGLADLEEHVLAVERTWQVSSAAELIALEVDVHAAYFERRPAFARLWIDGRASEAVAEQVRARHRDLARRMHEGLRAAGLIAPDTPVVVLDVAVELADRALAYAFEGRRRRDRVRLDLGTAALQAYVERVLA